MGWERVSYNDKYFDEVAMIISRVQKFMDLYLSRFEHPKWFIEEAMDDVRSNFHQPHGKMFFDEDVIQKSPERLTYALEMIDLCLIKMESITNKEFIEYIREGLKGTWCSLEDPFYKSEEWLKTLNEEEPYQKYSIGVLKSLKEIMQ